MPIPKAVGRFNKLLLNPLVGRIAPFAPGFGVVVHRGRRSGSEYRTPVNVFEADTGFAIALTYGPETDWVKNVIVAGEAVLLHRNREIGVADPRLTTVSAGHAHIPALVRRILRFIGAPEVILLDRDDDHQSIA